MILIHFSKSSRFFIALLAFFSLVCLTCLVHAQEQSNPKALSATIAGDTASTRFFMDFDKKSTYQVFYMNNPNRIIIDMMEADFEAIDKQQIKPRGLISKITYGRIAEGRSRIVLTLIQPSEIIKSSFAQRLDNSSHRLLIDMDSTDPKTFSHLIESQQENIGEAGLKAQKGDRIKVSTFSKKAGHFVIVLDPGHGGIDGGAIGIRKSKEKHIVLKFAQTLKQKIEQKGKFEVYLTREGDKFLTLRQRLNFGKEKQADLFISIHADSLKQRYVRGSTIYTLSKKASDKLSHQLAESVNQADLIGGVALSEESEEVSDILVDLTTRETKIFSKRFSRVLKNNLKNEIRLIKNPLRSAAFGVLKSPETPGVLLELGYLSNKQDEQLLNSEKWRDKASDAVAKSVAEFFSTRIQ